MLRGESNKEVCRTVLEASFFPPITSPLSIVYRCKNYQEEVAVAKNMCKGGFAVSVPHCTWPRAQNPHKSEIEPF